MTRVLDSKQVYLNLKRVYFEQVWDNEHKPEYKLENKTKNKIKSEYELKSCSTLKLSMAHLNPKQTTLFSTLPKDRAKLKANLFQLKTSLARTSPNTNLRQRTWTRSQTCDLANLASLNQTWAKPNPKWVKLYLGLARLGSFPVLMTSMTNTWT